MKAVFVKIPYEVFYDGTESDDPSSENFLPAEIPTGGGENVDLVFGTRRGGRLPLRESDLRNGYLADIPVIFCADAPNGALVTVGWYRWANVTPQEQVIELENEDGTPASRSFLFCARATLCVLLPEEERFSDSWRIPRNKQKTPGKFGMDASGVWFAEEPEAESFVTDFLSRLENYSGENLLFPEDEEDTEEPED